MGKLKNLILGLSILLIVFSCQQNEDLPPASSDSLYGNWVQPVYENETITFQKAASLSEKSYGISLSKNGSFLERSSGWCGTPPLSFFDYKGTWKLEDDLIMVSTQNYPGDFNWRIISLTSEQLVVKRELTEQEKDHQNLMNLFNEIQQMAESISCTDAINWNFTAYGSKACGGPQGYIAYSNTIDTVSFLNKVAVYTKLENDYNIKWGIISTCDITPQPVAVECQNGVPVLKY